jgi:hypothetical protein
MWFCHKDAGTIHITSILIYVIYYVPPFHSIATWRE